MYVSRELLSVNDEASIKILKKKKHTICFLIVI